MLVKLQRPPPEIRIFFPGRSERSSTATRRPRFPASAAQKRPAAPAPRTITSNRRLMSSRYCLRFARQTAFPEHLRPETCPAFLRGSECRRRPAGRGSCAGARNLPRPTGISLVRALGKQRHQHHQIRQGEQPLVGLRAGRFRGARDKAQVAALGEVVNVVDANPRQACDFGIGEDFLARFYGNQGLAPGPRPTASCTFYWFNTK